jgi:hypothetical protein
MAAALLLAAASGCAEREAPKDAAAPAPASQGAAVTKPRLKPDELIPPIPYEPVQSPFGDPWDPTRPPPVEPQPSGPGITSARLVASGPADVREYPRPEGTPPVFFGAVLDIAIAPGSTTEVLGPASVTLTPASGEAAPLFAACMPTIEDPTMVTTGAGTSLAAWTIAIGEQTWRCGDRNGRMIRRVSPAGFKLTGPAPAGWTGLLVLLFEGQDAPPKSVSIAGRPVEIPATPGQKPS